MHSPLNTCMLTRSRPEAPSFWLAFQARPALCMPVFVKVQCSTSGSTLEDKCFSFSTDWRWQWWRTLNSAVTAFNFIAKRPRVAYSCSHVLLVSANSEVSQRRKTRHTNGLKEGQHLNSCHRTNLNYTEVQHFYENEYWRLSGKTVRVFRSAALMTTSGWSALPGKPAGFPGRALQPSSAVHVDLERKRHRQGLAWRNWGGASCAAQVAFGREGYCMWWWWMRTVSAWNLWLKAVMVKSARASAVPGWAW